MNKDFWETCDPNFAHIAANGYHQGADMTVRWKREFLGRYSWDGKTVIDYGCGGGMLGEYLLAHYDCKYIAIDIAERQVKATKERVPQATVKLLPVDLTEFKADILICQSVIQHMPEKELARFMTELELSCIPEIVLQWRHGHSTWFDSSIKLHCFTNWVDILTALPSYEKAWLGPVGDCNTRYGGFSKCGTS